MHPFQPSGLIIIILPNGRKEKAMDVLKYIESKDERDYLMKIGYEFNALEASYLVFMCNGLTFKERHEEWQKIIDTMPDFFDCTRYTSEPCDVLDNGVHVFLRNYMDVKNKVFNELLKNESDAIYLYDTNPAVRSWDCKPYKSLEEALQTATTSPLGEHIVIQKRYFDSGEIIHALYNRKAELLEVSYYDLGSYPEDEYDFVAEFPFNLHISFPHPFQPGDIICHASDRTPLIFTGTTDESTYTIDSFDRHHASLYELYDYEYYRHKPRGKYRTLIPYSNFLKGKIDRDLFENAYHQILLEEGARRGRRSFCKYEPDVLEMLDLPVAEDIDFYNCDEEY